MKDNLDISLAISGCVFSIPLNIYLATAIGRPLFIAIGIISFLSFLTYLVLRRRSLPSYVMVLELTSTAYMLLSILFFGLLSYNIFTVYLATGHYIRPLGYFISSAAMAAVLAIEILFLPPGKVKVRLALFKIIIIGVSLIWSQLLIFPSIVGVDPWIHQQATLGLLDTGHSVGLTGYFRTPCFHLMVGETMLVTGLDYKMAAMMSVSLLLVVCNSLFIFLLGRLVHGTKAGLLAALLLGVSTWQIWFGVWTIPNTLAVIFIPIVLYLLIKLREERPLIAYSLCAVFMVALMFTHAVVTVWLLLLLYLLWIGFEIYRRMHYKGAVSGVAFLVAFALLAIATLSYWRFFTHHFNTILYLIQADFSAEYFGAIPPELATLSEGLSGLNRAVAQYRDSVPVFEQIFNQLGFFLYFGFAFIGSYAMLSRDVRNRHGFAIVFCGLFILALTFFAVVAYLGLLTGRWNYFCQLLLAVPVGVAVFWIGGLPHAKSTMAILTGIIAFVLTFLMIMSPLANMDNRTFSPNTIVRFAFTKSEMQAAAATLSIYSGQIGVDDRYKNMVVSLPNSDENKVVSLIERLYSRDFSDYNRTYILIRKEIVDNPFDLNGPFRLEYDPRKALNGQGFSKVYENGSVSGFLNLYEME